MERWAPRLALRKRLKVIRNWPVALTENEKSFCSNLSYKLKCFVVVLKLQFRYRNKITQYMQTIFKVK